jgi:hypothetical protein
MQPTITTSQIRTWVAVMAVGAAASAPRRGAPAEGRGVWLAGDRWSSLMRRDCSVARGV